MRADDSNGRISSRYGLAGPPAHYDKISKDMLQKGTHVVEIHHLARVHFADRTLLVYYRLSLPFFEIN